jgi:hypothetical protein
MGVADGLFHSLGKGEKARHGAYLDGGLLDDRRGQRHRLRFVGGSRLVGLAATGEGEGDEGKGYALIHTLPDLGRWDERRDTVLAAARMRLTPADVMGARARA